MLPSGISNLPDLVLPKLGSQRLIEMVTKLSVAIVVSATGMLLLVGGITFGFIRAGPVSHGAITGGAVLIAIGTLLYCFTVTKKKR